MFVNSSQQYCLIALTIWALLNALCTRQNDVLNLIEYQQTPEDKKNFLSETQNTIVGNRFAAVDIDSLTLARNRPAFHSMVLNSGYYYQYQTLWHKESHPHNITVGNREKTSKPAPEHHTTLKKQQSSSTKNSKASQKKSIETIDNKKMVVLNFGWPIKGKVLKRFSPPSNKGIDIAGKQGQSIKAAEAGKVVYGGQGLIGFGKLLIIKHNDDYLSAYANNKRLLVNEGQQVKKGQVIAETGKVGSKRTALHFEIRKHGMPVNPLQLLPKK